MSVEAFLFVLTCTGTGGAIGWLVVPSAVDFLLKRAYKRASSWWWDSCRMYCAFKRAHPHVDPSASAPGEEGALGIWLADALQSVRAGTLTYERAQALVDTGICVGKESDLRCEADQEARCSFSANRWQRALCACGCAVWGGMLAMSGLPGLPLGALAVCSLSMTLALVCDLRARLLPLECCVVLAVAGGVFQMWMAGVSGLVVGAVFGLVIGVACVVSNHFFGRTGVAPVGWGDVRCMVALSLTCGAAVPMGLAVCYAAAAVVSGVGLAMRKLTVRDGIPMAPFLALWFITGVGVLVCGWAV